MKVSQSCPTLCSPWNSPGQDTEVGSRSLLQGIFPTQGLNQGLLHCRRILYQLSYEGSSKEKYQGNLIIIIQRMQRIKVWSCDRELKEEASIGVFKEEQSWQRPGGRKSSGQDGGRERKPEPFWEVGGGESG